MLRAELLEDLRSLRQGMTRERRPYVMLHLIVEATGEPVVENGRSYVSRCSHLERDKVCGIVLIRGQDIHRVVTDRKDNADEQSAEALRQQNENGELGKAAEVGKQHEVSGVVNSQA